MSEEDKMGEEKQKIVKFEDGKLKVTFAKSFDPNNDGEPLGSVSFNMELELSEIPDEALDAWKKMREKK